MFIFSVSETLASEGACVWHKNTSLPWYSRVCTFGFLYLIAPTFNKRLIFRYFIYNRKCTHYSRFLNRGSRGARALDTLLTLALCFRLRSSWRFKYPRPDSTNRFINPFIMFTFHWGFKIRIIRPRNRTAFTRSTIHHIYIRVTWRSHDQNVRLRRMTREAAFTKVFPAKKGTKRHTKHLVSVSMSYPRHLDGIPKKWPVSRRLSLICGPFAKRILFQTSGKKTFRSNGGRYGAVSVVRTLRTLTLDACTVKQSDPLQDKPIRSIRVNDLLQPLPALNLFCIIFFSNCFTWF